MVKTFDDMQKIGKDGTDVAMRSFGAFSKTSQAIAAEMIDYQKRSFEDGTKALEKLFGARSLDKAIEIQAEYARTAYENFMVEATKISELYADLAKDSAKPFEAMSKGASAR